MEALNVSKPTNGRCREWAGGAQETHDSVMRSVVLQIADGNEFIFDDRARNPLAISEQNEIHRSGSRDSRSSPHLREVISPD